MLEFFYLINFLFIILLFIFIFTKNDLLSYLIISEFFWVLFYLMGVILGIPYDVMYLLLLNIVILIFSGLEISVGLLIYFFF